MTTHRCRLHLELIEGRLTPAVVVDPGAAVAPNDMTPALVGSEQAGEDPQTNTNGVEVAANPRPGFFFTTGSPSDALAITTVPRSQNVTGFTPVSTGPVGSLLLEARDSISVLPVVVGRGAPTDSTAPIPTGADNPNVPLLAGADVSFSGPLTTPTTTGPSAGLAGVAAAAQAATTNAQAAPSSPNS